MFHRKRFNLKHFQIDPRGTFSYPSMTRTREFPATFHFGVATADHQCEAYDPFFPSIWDVWERENNLTLRGRATDFWHRYKEDIDLAKDLGCKLFRFSIAWSRVEPEAGRFDSTALNHYCDLAACIRNAGMTPVITLLHNDWPIHIEESGGMVAEHFPARFQAYAEEVNGALGDNNTYWITFNEPNELVFGYVKAFFQKRYSMPPGLPQGVNVDVQVDHVVKLINNLFIAHKLARSSIKNNQQTLNAKVGSNPFVLGLPALTQLVLDCFITHINKHRLTTLTRLMTNHPLKFHGSADLLLSALSFTKERASNLNLSDVYLIAGIRVMTSAHNTDLSLDDLQNQPVAVIENTTADLQFEAILPMARKLPVKGHQKALDALDSKHAVAFADDDILLQGFIAAHPGKYRLIESKPLTEEHYVAAVAQGFPTFDKEVDKAVREFIDSGQWRESFIKHFGFEPDYIPNIRAHVDLSYRKNPPPPPARGELPLPGMTQRAIVSHLQSSKIELSPQNQLPTHIRKRNKLIVAINGNSPGLSVKENGQWRGLEIDLARHIALRTLGNPDDIDFKTVRPHERIQAITGPFIWIQNQLKLLLRIRTLFTSNWWYLGMAGKLPQFLCPAGCEAQLDFVGIDYYWGARSLPKILQLFKALDTDFSTAPVWPERLYSILRWHSGLFKDKEILIVENGSVDIASGMTRPEYIQKHYRQVQKAINSGMNVSGYICWSITSNREWGKRFIPGTDFGLYHIDLDLDERLHRIPTTAALVYTQLIKDQSASSSRAEKTRK